MIVANNDGENEKVSVVSTNGTQMALYASPKDAYSDLSLPLFVAPSQAATQPRSRRPPRTSRASCASWAGLNRRREAGDEPHTPSRECPRPRPMYAADSADLFSDGIPGHEGVRRLSHRAHDH